MTTPWSFGYWTKGWNEPDPKNDNQHWEGSDLIPWSINKALERAIKLGFLDATKREIVKLACLNDGEYLFGSDESSGWMIEKNDMFDGFSLCHKNPIWMMVQIKDDAKICCPVLDSYDIWQLKQQNRIIKSNLTLPEILDIVLPGREKNPKYLDVCLQCLYAASPTDSYTCKLESNQWVQICRKELNDEDCDDEDCDDEE